MDNWDEEEEEGYNPFYKKRKHNKEDAIYGVFRDDESSDDEEELIKRSEKMFNNVSAPMGFVSAGNLEDPRNKDGVFDDIERSQSGTSTAKKAASNKVEFEKHTKGIGSKLLKSMGWKPGEGLGKEGTGINRPIEVKVRPKTMGLGFGGDELTQQQKEDFMGEPSLDLKAQPQKREQAWKRTTSAKKTYKLPTELPQQSRIIITDMRGEQPKVISDLSEITSEEQGASSFLPELQHNIRLLADMKEADIINIDKKKATERDHIRKYEQDKEQLEKIVQLESEKIGRLTEIVEIVSKAQEKIKTKEISLSAIAKMFLLFQKKFKEEYFKYKLNQMASTMVLPLLKGEIDSWNPFEKPTFAVEEFLTWKELMPPVPLSERDTEEAETDLYTELVCDLVLPKLRFCITNMWEVKNPTPLMRLLDAWHEALPELVLDNILESLVLPKLSMVVDDWNPRTDTVPIDKWLHPWLPFLGNRLEPFYAPIRNKLAVALKDWNPSDRSAKILLAPWKSVFDAASWDSLMTRAILPKLTEAMHGFTINPREQDLKPFEWMLNWIDLIPMPRIVHLLETEFFPKWQQVLYTWLSSNPDYAEIMRWYVGWKSQFSESLVSNDRIRQQFTHALTVMDNAITGGSGYRPTPFVPAKEEEQEETKKPRVVPISEESFNFKEIVEHFADSNGLLLMKTSKFHEGNPIYQLGKVFIYLDNVKQLVYKQNKGEWNAVSFDNLLKQ